MQKRVKTVAVTAALIVIAFIVSGAKAEWKTFADAKHSISAFKIENNKCYEQMFVGDSWVEFDCIERIKEMEIQLNIFSEIRMKRDFWKQGFLSQDAFDYFFSYAEPFLDRPLEHEQYQSRLNALYEEAKTKYPLKGEIK